MQYRWQCTSHVEATTGDSEVHFFLLLVVICRREFAQVILDHPLAMNNLPLRVVFSTTPEIGIWIGVDPKINRKAYLIMHMRSAL